MFQFFIDAFITEDNTKEPMKQCDLVGSMSDVDLYIHDYIFLLGYPLGYIDYFYHWQALFLWYFLEGA